MVVLRISGLPRTVWPESSRGSGMWLRMHGRALFTPSQISVSLATNVNPIANKAVPDRRSARNCRIRSSGVKYLISRTWRSGDSATRLLVERMCFDMMPLILWSLKELGFHRR